MERLKAALADKILDLSTNNSDDVKSKVDKIQRFRDFANACQTLMKKYPQIEDELIAMVDANDYDTKVASSRVDTIIRMADSNSNNNSGTTEIRTAQTEAEKNEEEILIPETFEEQEPAPIWQPEDTDYEEVETPPEDEIEKGYVPYEEVNATNNKTVINETVETEINKELSEEEQAALQRKATMRKVVQVVGIIVAILVVIFIVKFVLVHWKVILIILGAALALLGIFWYFKRKR